MDLKRILSLVLALMMALGTLALAESDDLQAQLEAAQARIAELEAEVEQYRPVYESQVVAEYGDDGVVMLTEAQQQYAMVAQMYAQYGISVDQYANDIKQSVLSGIVEAEVLGQKEKELGLDPLDEQTMADLRTLAEQDLETYVGYYGERFATEGASDEENHQAAIDGLAQAGYTVENLLAQRVDERLSELLVDHVTKDVTVDEADVKSQYDEMVKDAKDNYTDEYTYISAFTSGEPIVWNPEGYRAVKHVLIKFEDEQASQLSSLESTLRDLESELYAVNHPEEAAAAEEAAAQETVAAIEEAAESAETEEELQDVADTAEAVAEVAEAAEAIEAETPPRTAEEIQTDIGQVGASIEALYSTLLPKAQEVVDAFNNGTDFDTLIAQYGEDPGMTTEPTATKGYPVAKDVSYWDDAFTDGAMAIANVGEISEPVRGMYGIHIIYYMSDITPGEVPFEEVKGQIETVALEEKKNKTYEDQVAQWVEEAHPVYHLDRFVG